MDPRAFIAGGGALLLTVSFAAEAQQAVKPPRIGYLSDEMAAPYLFHSHDSVLNGLRERGYAEGRNIVIEYRYAAGKPEQLPSLAAELATLPVDLILAVGTPAARAALGATRTIPLVFARSGDLIGLGLVAGLARPGGNATGVVAVLTTDLGGKRLELLKNAVPGLARVAVLHEQNFPPSELELKQFTAAARSLQVQLHAVGVRSLAALEGALPDIMKEPPEALFVGSSGWFEDNHRLTTDLALKSRLPALYVRREYAEVGGLISYGVNYREMYRTPRITLPGFSKARSRRIFRCSSRRR